MPIQIVFMCRSLERSALIESLPLTIAPDFRKNNGGRQNSTARCVARQGRVLGSNHPCPVAISERPRMNVSRLDRIATCALAAALLVPAGAAVAQRPYPDKPIRLVLPFPPGGGTDALARALAPKLTERMGQTLVVDNRAGAAGNISSEIVSRAAADGYTLLFTFANMLTVNPLLYKLPFDVGRDFAPITQLGTAQFFLVVHPSVPARSVKELIALAREKPGQLNYASSGPG